jgi:hypothetical protein
MLTLEIDVGCRMKGTKIMTTRAVSSQYDRSGSQPETPAADIAIKAGVASN